MEWFWFIEKLADDNWAVALGVASVVIVVGFSCALCWGVGSKLWWIYILGDLCRGFCALGVLLAGFGLIGWGAYWLGCYIEAAR